MTGQVTRRALLGGLSVLPVAALGLAGCSKGPTDASKATDALEVVSWWTSGSESRALAVLLNAFQASHPQVSITNATVAGGAGSRARVALASRLQQGDQPDVWQAFSGRSAAEYGSRGYSRDVSGLYQAGIASTLVPSVLTAMTADGKQYGVPTSVHRSNTMFYSPQAFKKAGVAAPGAGYTVDQMLSDVATIKSRAKVPMGLGAADAFTINELFENLLLAQIGQQGWADIVADRFRWDSPKVTTALRQLTTLVDAAGTAAKERTWVTAATELANGSCSVLVMNDSVYGELVATGAMPGTDFVALPFPGTEQTFVGVIDAMVAGQRAVNAKNALDFLKTVAVPANQVAFSKIKGSVPAVKGVDVASLSPYQQKTYHALGSTPLLQSIVHGEAMSPAFQQGFYDAVAAYLASGDPAQFVKTLQNAVADQQAGGPPR